MCALCSICRRRCGNGHRLGSVTREPRPRTAPSPTRAVPDSDHQSAIKGHSCTLRPTIRSSPDTQAEDLGVWSDREQGDLTFIGPVAPEETVRTRSSVLNVGLKHFGAGVKGMWDGVVLVRLKTRVPGILEGQIHAFSDLPEEAFCLGGSCPLVLLAILQGRERCRLQLQVLYLRFGRPAGPKGTTRP